MSKTKIKIKFFLYFSKLLDTLHKENMVFLLDHLRDPAPYPTGGEIPFQGPNNTRSFGPSEETRSRVEVGLRAPGIS